MMERKELETLLEQAVAPEWPALRMSIVSAVAAAVSSVLLLGVSGWFITGAALAGLGGVAAAQAYNYMMPSAGIRLLAIVRTVSRYGERYYSHRAALIALATVRARLFRHILGARDVRSVSAGDAVARLVQDIGALEDRLVRRPALPAALAGGGAGLALAALAGPLPALALLALLAGLLLVVMWLSPHLLNGPATDLAETLGALKKDMVDYAQASPEIVAYGMAPALRLQLESQAGRVDAARLKLAQGEALIGALLTLGGGIAMAAALALSYDASLPLRVLAVLSSAGAVEALGPLVRGIMRDAVVRAGLTRLEALAGIRRSDPHRAELKVPLAGREIALSAPSASITVKAGERLAIIGRSGSGKTRLIEALAGIRPEDAGQIMIDGHACADLSVEAQRSLFALSPQDALLISGTVRDNLRLARSGLDDDALWDALETACLADDVRAMPAGLDYWVGDGGASLSGGQRKRLSIARSLLAGRPWLLLDEPSEGLDAETERDLLDRLKGWLDRTGAGLVLVSHRPALLALCNRQLYLDRVG